MSDASVSLFFCVMETFGKLLRDNIVAMLIGFAGIFNFYMDSKVREVEDAHYREVTSNAIKVIESRLSKKIKEINRLKEEVSELQKCEH